MLQIIRQSKSEHIEKFALYGERHSGTKFLQQSLECFDIKSTGFFGNKHWFGFVSDAKIEYAYHTLFVCIVRNPVQWIAAYYNNPFNVSQNNRNWNNFLNNEWLSIDSRKKEIIADRNINNPKKRYKNIFELRSVKTKYLYEQLPCICRNYVFLTYENLTNNYLNVLNIIQNIFRLKQIEEFPKPHEPIVRQIPEKYFRQITLSIDWSIENKIGYYLK